MNHFNLPGALLLAMSLSQTLTATQPQGPDVDVTTRFTAHGGLVHFGNNEATPVTLVILASADSTVKFASKRVVLAPGMQLNVDLGTVVYPAGLQVFHLESRFYDGTQNLPSGPGPAVYQPIMVDGSGGITPVAYEDAFPTKRRAVPGDSERAVIDLGGAQDISPIAALAFDSADSSGAPSITPLNPGITPFDLARMPLMTLPAAGAATGSGGIDFRPTAVLAPVDDSVPQAQFHSNVTPGFSTGVKGHFSLKLPDGSHQAAWGWVVRV